MSELSDEEIIERTTALVDGLEEIAKRYGEHVFLALEDPVTFGGGHFVLYPEEGGMTPFAIEEHYMDTDWSDDDYPWESLAQGEVAPGHYAQRLGLTEDWAKRACRTGAGTHH